MGTKVQHESYFLAFPQMRDLSDDSNTYNCMLYRGDNKAFTSGQFYNGLLARGITDTHSGHGKDLVKRTMLEHEAIFRNQLYELHRLYRIQRDMMEEVKTKDPRKSPLASSSQVTSEGARKCNIPGFPLGTSVCTRPSTSAIENIKSPLSSVKGSSTYGSPFAYQNGSASKDIEILESRPTKVRRKMFNLRLPADEYIDTEEGKPLRDNVLFVKAKNQLTKGNPSGTARNDFSGGKISCQDDVSLSRSFSRGKTSVADLNEPIVIEETSTSEHLSVLGNSARPDLRNGGKHWLSCTDDTGYSTNNLKSASGTVQAERLPSSSRPMHVLFTGALEPTTQSERNREAVTASSISSQYPFSPDSSKSLSHSALSRERPNGILHQNAFPVQVHPSATLRKSSQSSAKSNGMFGDRWNCNNISISNRKLGSEMSNQNGYYHGISTPSGSYYGHMNCGTADNLATEQRADNGSVRFYQGSNCMDLKAVKDVNLNVATSNGPSNKVLATQQNVIEVIDLERKDSGNRSSLPWLRALPVFWNEATSSGKFSIFDPSSSNRLVGHGKKSASRSEVDEILGFPLFQNAHVPKKALSSSSTSPPNSIPHPSEVKVENKAKTLPFDMNMPCDMADFAPRASDEMGIVRTDAKVSNFRCEIDLNSCLSEDEASFLPCVPDSEKKTFTGIDLEAPVVPEVDDDVAEPSPTRHLDAERPQDELSRVAAEAIIAISSSGFRDQSNGSGCTIPEEVSAPDLLHWFADIISSRGDDLGNKLKVKDNDYFESMTLKLVETKEEDYIPKPLVPEGLKLEEPGTSCPVPSRARRGNARRGRQRRDFQRDILPGLASLSRHEVTEDLQAFGGMMRATGLTWQSRNSTRSGCGRGRRRLITISPPPPLPLPPLIHEVNTVEVGLEDRSLRGWGKTTRRPRGQRCHAGNLPTLPVT